MSRRQKIDALKHKLSQMPPQPPPRPAPLSARLPCVHEGSVVEFSTCRGPIAELRHVRLCAHPSADAPDKCVRGSTGRPGAVQSCRTCNLYEAPG